MRSGAKPPDNDGQRYRQVDRDAPGLPEELTAEWVTQAMQAAGVLSDGQRVVSANA